MRAEQAHGNHLAQNFKALSHESLAFLGVVHHGAWGMAEFSILSFLFLCLSFMFKRTGDASNKTEQNRGLQTSDLSRPLIWYPSELKPVKG